jgi:aminomethyltransferase
MPPGRSGNPAHPVGCETDWISLPNGVPEDLRKTPLYEDHRTLGARLVPFAGWAMPIQFAGISAEHRAVREAAGLFDVSHMGEILVTGSDAVAAVNRLVTNDLSHAEDGQALYTCCCNEQGGILDDLIVYRHARDRVVVVCNASNRAKIIPHFATRATGPNAQVRDISDDTALLALQGPRALGILASAGSSLDVANGLPSFRLAPAQVGGIDCTLARTGYTGEDGVELFCATSDAIALWRRLLEAGREVGLQPVGLGARDTLRLEARLSLYGNEIDETTHPFEAGLGWTVKLDADDFVGRDALRELKARPLTRKICGFEMVGKGIARHGYPLVDADGSALGVCTSGAPSPTLGRSIGLGYVPPDRAAVGASLWVDCRGKRIEARVVRTPFYRRPKAS